MTTKNARFIGAALWLAVAGCGGPLDSSTVDSTSTSSDRAQRERAPVLVLAVDGLRYDHTAIAGYDRDTTPFLRDLAMQSWVFTDVWTPSPSRRGSHVALLSGADPSLAQPPRPTLTSASASRSTAARDSDLGPTSEPAWAIPVGLALVSRAFLASGWTTAAFFETADLAELRGIRAGFREVFRVERSANASSKTVAPGGEGELYPWLESRRGSDDPWFAYVQISGVEHAFKSPLMGLPQMDAVAAETKRWVPRESLLRVPPLGDDEPLLFTLPPSRAALGNPLTLGEYELRYDRALRFIDRRLQRIVQRVDEVCGGGVVTIVIVGASGLQLGESGLYLSAGMAREEDLRVPLLIRPATTVLEGAFESRLEDPGMTFANLISTTDLAPTLVALHGLDPLPSSDGLEFVSSALIDTGDTEGHAATGARQRLLSTASFGDGALLISESHLVSNGRGVAYGALIETRWSSGARPMEKDSAPEVVARGQRRIERWQSLLLEQRRQLHFGSGRADTERGDELRSQAVDPDPASPPNARD